MRLAIPCLLVAFAALPGCKSTRNERVKTRRDPALIEQNERAMRPLTPSELAELFADEREARRVRPDVERWNEHYRDTREAVAAVTRGVPRDPWLAEELDRRRVLLRPWADVGRKRVPEPDPLPEPRGEYADEQDGTGGFGGRRPPVVDTDGDDDGGGGDYDD
ncbi:MAG: hypothetical protein KF878_22580 [Planctomycetes bacterium]|nr:hypothetical protein [Planctomycetota bacterium]